MAEWAELLATLQSTRPDEHARRQVFLRSVLDRIYNYPSFQHQQQYLLKWTEPQFPFRIQHQSQALSWTRLSNHCNRIEQPWDQKRLVFIVPNCSCSKSA